MLSGVDKDRIIPLIPLQKWHHKNPISASVDKVRQMLGGRYFAADIIRPIDPKHDPDIELEALCDSGAGYANWCNFVDAHEDVIPTLQRFGSQDDLRRQAERLLDMGRGIFLRVKKDDLWQSDDLGCLRGLKFDRSNITILMDYGQLYARQDVNLAALESLEALRKCSLSSGIADANVAFCATSFPGGFKEIHPTGAVVEIRERQYHRVIRDSAILQQLGFHCLYSDRASVHAGKRGGGGQGPAPRVDYPDSGNWIYERREIDALDINLNDKEKCYRAAAVAVRESDYWQEDIVAWGSQRIRQAADGDLVMLDSPQRWTSVRINLHLHRQVNYNDPLPPEAHEDEWVD